MLKRYITIKENGQHETEIKKSRFICTLARIESEDEAKEIIEKIKKEHWKANHNCSAFVLGDRNEIQRSSDDGEPSGTAGVPMLEVLKKREVINTLAVVTRYFGGTKLGAGGLIRAYSGSVAEGMNHVGLVEGNLQQEISVTLDYASHGKLENFITNSAYDLKETNFTEVVEAIIMVDVEEVEKFENEMADLLSGQGKIQLRETMYFEKDLS